MRFYERAPFRPITRRPPLVWPNGAKLAVWVVPNIEHYDEDSLTAPGIGAGGAKQPPDIINSTWRDYGLRVGVWRTMKTLDSLDIPGTVALNSFVCDHFPEVVKACVDLGWDFMGHGRSNSEWVTHVATADDERKLIADTLDGIERFTGTRPQGWLGPGLHETSRTPDILAELGVGYVGDWINDEQPYWLRTTSRPIVSMPYSVECNDLGLFMRRGYTGPDYERLLCDTFDELLADAADAARVMCVATHPFVTGVPHRARYLHSSLAYMRAKSDVWFATGAQILEAFRAQVPVETPA